jgi:hypothetical protein
MRVARSSTALRRWNIVKPIVLSFSVLLLAACTGGHRQQATVLTTTNRAPSSATATGTSHGAFGQPACRPPSPINRNGIPEVEGTSDRIQTWGLIMADGPDDPLRVNEQVKIVWRITGSGDLHLTTIDPNGRTHPLQWGPDPHTSSSYTRPGDEWGAGYLFTEPGCWTLRATRGPTSANVWLKIAA